MGTEREIRMEKNAVSRLRLIGTLLSLLTVFTSGPYLFLRGSIALYKEIYLAYKAYKRITSHCHK